MTIEVPSLEDYDKINELAIEVHNMHVEWNNDLYKYTNVVLTKDEYKELIDNKNIYCVKYDNNLVAYILIAIREKNINDSKMRYRKILKIESICVTKDYRNKGIGTKILEFIDTLAKTNNCTDIYLDVNNHNKKAIKLYEKMGFIMKQITYSKKVK